MDAHPRSQVLPFKHGGLNFLSTSLLDIVM